jgi:hypothetical protein
LTRSAAHDQGGAGPRGCQRSGSSAVLEALERRILGLRATLNLGGIQALPAVATVMGEDKFVASRMDSSGRVTAWRLTSRISTAYLFARIDDQGKKGANFDEPAFPCDLGGFVELAPGSDRASRDSPMIDHDRCMALQHGASYAAPRCQESATHASIFGRRCAPHAEELRCSLRSPTTLSNLLGPPRLPRAEAEIARMVVELGGVK